MSQYKKILFFLATLGLTLGPAGQHFVLYVFLILGGGYLWKPWQWPWQWRRHLVTIGLGCLLMATAFYIPVWWGAWEMGGLGMLPPGWSKSRLGSGVTVTAAALLLMAAPWRRGLATTAQREVGFPARTFQPLVTVSQGALLWSSLISIYLVLQHITGFDPRFPQRSLPDHFQLSTGFFRVMGFTGNPLSVSGQSLSWLTCFGTLGLLVGPGNRALGTCAWAVGGLHFFAVFMAGGRTALAIALAFGALGVAVAFLRAVKGGRGIFPWVLSIALGAGALCALVVLGGYGQRALDFLHKQPERLQFWRVYNALFWEKPLWGHGYAWLDAGVRTAKYDAMGLMDFPEKFNAHNVFLETLGCAGVLGAALALGGFAMVVRTLGVYVRHDPLAHFFASGWVVAIVANALHGFTQNTFFDTSVSAFYIHSLWILLWAAAPQDAPTQDHIKGTASL